MADNVGLPLTGVGDTTATVATDDIGGAHYQRIKLFSGVADSTLGVAALTTTPSTAEVGLVTRNIPSTSVAQLVSGGGSTTVDANNTSAGSTKLIGLVDGVTFSTGGMARTTLNTSVDVSLIAANANRKGLMIANGSTGTALLVSMNSTVAVTSGGNYSFQVQPLTFVFMGGQVGNLPNFTGLARAKMNSTAVAGPVFVTEYTS